MRFTEVEVMALSKLDLHHRIAAVVQSECLAYVDGLIAHQNIFGVASEEHLARLGDGLMRLLR